MATPSVWYKLDTVADITINYGSHGGTVSLLGSDWNIVDGPYYGVGNAAGPAALDNYTNLHTPTYDYLTGSQKPWSIALWYKTPVDSGGEQNNSILMYGMNDNYQHLDFEYRNGTSYKYFRFPQNGIGYASTSSSVASDTWVFVVATFDGTDFNWYLDGAVDKLSQSGNIGGTVPYVSWFQFRGFWPRSEAGTVGDFKFFEEELSLEDIEQLYDEGIYTPTPSKQISFSNVNLTGLRTV